VNKKVILSLIVILTILLSACSNASAAQTSASGQGNGTPSPNEAALSEPMQLVVGTFKLEDTDLAVQADQAADLLTLWQAYQALVNSDTAAQAEIDGLIKQIQATMTTDQMQAITNMNLTYQDVTSIMQAYGGPRMQGTPGANGTAFPNAGNFNRSGNGSSSGGGNFPSGGGGYNRSGGGGGFSSGGGAPPEGFQVGGGQGFYNMDPSAQATAQASGTTTGVTSGVNPMLLRALIDLLDGKVQAGQ
jgi:hypothetical protein